jgi:hypothetical protein
MDSNGRLPPTLYVQVDGGPENANKLVWAVLSFLIAKRVGGLQKIVLTRMPVGHTHEDIDGIFGRISQHIKELHVLTPLAYENAIREALKKNGILEVEVKDINVIPDYAKFFANCVDRNFGCSFKNDFAKLQFTIEAVSVNPYYHPVGVKLTCRRFVSDIYPNLVIDDAAPFGIAVQKIKSRNFPEPGGPPLNVLLALPSSGKITPDEFKPGYTKLTNQYLRKMRKMYSKDKKTMDELEDFENKFPNEESSEKWVVDHKKDYYVPFREIFHDFSKTVADIAPMRYLGYKSVDDKDILREYKIIDDVDTIRRSCVIVRDGTRLYYEDKKKSDSVPKKPSVSSLAVRSSKTYSKFSGCIGVRYSDLEENTKHVINSIFEQANDKGSIVPYFRIKTLPDDDGDESDSADM